MNTLAENNNRAMDNGNQLSCTYSRISKEYLDYLKQIPYLNIIAKYIVWDLEKCSSSGISCKQPITICICHNNWKQNQPKSQHKTQLPLLEKKKKNWSALFFSCACQVQLFSSDHISLGIERGLYGLESLITFFLIDTYIKISP